MLIRRGGTAVIGRVGNMGSEGIGWGDRGGIFSTRRFSHRRSVYKAGGIGWGDRDGV